MMRTGLHISSKELAARLNVSERAVRLRGQKNGWPCIRRKVQGGACHLYLLSGLPEEVRSMLAPRPLLKGGAAAAGVARARALEAEAEAARRSRQRAMEAGMAAYQLLPEGRKAEARARREILAARDAFVAAAALAKKTGTTLFIREYRAGAIALPEWIAQALGSRQGQLALSWATLHRWEKALAEHGLAGLACGYKATRETGIAQHMQDFIMGLLTKRPHVGMPTVRAALQARFDGQDTPSASAIRRFVERWRKEHAAVIMYTTSPDEARNLYMPAFGQADAQVQRLNQLWEFDSTPADVMLADGRHSLIGVIDVFSRRAKLYVTPTSKSAAVAALTRRALLDWGVPESAKTDNGADYVSSHMVRVFEDLGIEQVLCREFHPEQKPHIERFFKTFLHGMFELLPGFIGHSVADRKKIEARRSFASRMMDKDADPVEVKMTADELQSFCDRWCEAVYHQNGHASLGGKTPAQAAREWTGPARRIGDERALDILLAPAPDKDGTRVVGKHGIKVDNAFFVAPELGPHVNKTVYVLLDATDYGTIHVFEILADGRKAFLCRAVNPDRTGHDRAEIAAKGKAAYNRAMNAGRRELHRFARQAELDEIGNEVLSYRERQIANVHEFPHRSQEHSTPALEQASLALEDIRRAELGPCPIGITAEQELAAAELIDIAAARRDARPLPATAQEKYEQLSDDLRRGQDLPDADMAWMKRYELWLETGERAQLY